MTSPTLVAPTAAKARAYERHADPGAHVRLGVVSNPFSRTNARTRLYDRILPRFMQDGTLALSTRTLADFDRALHYLLFDRGVNVLGLNGGDGTLHLGVNRLIELRRRTLEETGCDLPLPKLLFLNGGTLNIVSRATGTKGNPAGTVRRFRKVAHGKRLGELPLRRLQLLRVREHERSHPARLLRTRYGFVFGTEVIANALEMYAMFGEGYAGLARFLVELTVGYVFNTRLWQEHGWKMDPPRSGLSVDDVTYPRWLAGVASTIDLSILKGVVTAVRVPDGQEGLAGKLILETRKGQILRMIPWLMFDRPHPRAADLNGASQLRMTGGYTLDGEVFVDRSPRGQRRELVVDVAQQQVEAIAPP